MTIEPMTEHGYAKLSNELHDLKSNQRPAIVVEIDIARSHGDLKENAEYHAAKEKQAFIDARIAELSDMITKCKIVDPATYPHESVKFGSSVTLLDLESEEELKYTIVGSTESAPERGLISYNSPLAKQILGKKKGDEFTVKLPGRTQEFEVLAVCFEPIKF